MPEGSCLQDYQNHSSNNSSNTAGATTAKTCSLTDSHACVNKCMHTCIHTSCMHTCMTHCMHTCMRTCIHTCACITVCTGVNGNHSKFLCMLMMICLCILSLHARLATSTGHWPICISALATMCLLVAC